MMADADRQTARVAARISPRRETSGTPWARALRTPFFETTVTSSILLFLCSYLEICLSEVVIARTIQGLRHYTPKCCS
jgi:hypothetical protein